MNGVMRVFTMATIILLGLLSPRFTPSEPPLRSGTIVMGVPRDHFVVLGADRLWSNALPRAGDPPSERQGRQVKIAVHDSLPLAVAAAGLATLGPEQDTVEHIRRLISAVDASRLNFDTIVELLRKDLLERLEAIREPAKHALARNPQDAEAKTRLRVARLTLIVAYVAAGRATLGTLELDDRWTAKLVAPPRGAVAWPDVLDVFYGQGPFAGATAMFKPSIQEPVKLGEHVRGVIEAGIREDARLSRNGYRHADGPVDVVLIDARGARCVPSCSPP